MRVPAAHQRSVGSELARARPLSALAQQVSFQGNGPLQNLQTIADAGGLVKGKLGNPTADPPLRSDGKLNVGAAVGQGAHGVHAQRAAACPGVPEQRPSLRRQCCPGREVAAVAAQACSPWCAATQRRSVHTQAWWRYAAARSQTTWRTTWRTQSRWAQDPTLATAAGRLLAAAHSARPARID